jgi:hypothetical protein
MTVSAKTHPHGYVVSYFYIIYPRTAEGYKTTLFIKYYKYQILKNPYNYFKMFKTMGSKVYFRQSIKEDINEIFLIICTYMRHTIAQLLQSVRMQTLYQ